MPPEIAQLDQLLTEAAGLAGLTEVHRAADDRPTWSLSSAATSGTQEGDGELVVEWHQASRRMMFRATVGRLPSPDRRSALEEALELSLIWRQTGGARMALTPETDSLQLLIDLTEEDLSSHAIADLATRLLGMSRDWRAGQGIDRDAPGEADDAEADRPLTAPGRLRV